MHGLLCDCPCSSLIGLLLVFSILQQPGADPSSSYKYRYRPYDLDVVTRKQVRVFGL
jgi:hypothetical protein